jgi:NADH-quinone oxidoreductase subunit H
MRFGWKFLIPASLVWIVAVAVIQGTRLFTETSRTQTFVIIGVLAVVGLAIGWFSDSRAAAADEPRGGWELGEVDPFAGGHPVPPLPGQEAVISRGHAVGDDRALTAARTAPQEESRG